jgi:hypothetical protein
MENHKSEERNMNHIFCSMYQQIIYVISKQSHKIQFFISTDVLSSSCNAMQVNLHVVRRSY